MATPRAPASWAQVVRNVLYTAGMPAQGDAAPSPQKLAPEHFMALLQHGQQPKAPGWSDVKHSLYSELVHDDSGSALLHWTTLEAGNPLEEHLLSILVLYVAVMRYESKSVYMALMRLSEEHQLRFKLTFEKILHAGNNLSRSALEACLDYEEPSATTSNTTAATRVSARPGAMPGTPKLHKALNSLTEDLYSYSPMVTSIQKKRACTSPGSPLRDFLESPVTKQIAQFKEIAHAHKKLNQDMRLKLDQEKANAFTLQEQLANCQRDLTELRASLRAAREELSQQQESTGHVDDLGLQIKELEKKLKDRSSEKQIEHRELELLEARTQLENKEKELECWKQKLQDSHKRTTTFEDNLIGLRIKLGAKVQENAALEATIKEKENELSEMAQLLDEMRTSKSSLSLNDSLMATEPEVLGGIVEADLRSKLDAMEQQLTQTREALGRKEQEQLSAVEALNRLTEEMYSYSPMVASLQKKRACASASSPLRDFSESPMTKQIAQFKEIAHAHKKLNQDMRLELDQEKANTFALQEQLANCQRDLTELRAAREELLEARLQLENKEKDLECWKQKLQDSHKQTTASEDNLIALRIELGAKVQEIATLEATIKEKENAHKKLNQDMCLELDQEKANAIALQEQLANCQRDLTVLRAAREELLEARTQLENKEKELECWKQKLQDSHEQTTASEDNLIALRIELGAKVQENAALEETIKEKENAHKKLNQDMCLELDQEKANAIALQEQLANCQRDLTELRATREELLEARTQLENKEKEVECWKQKLQDSHEQTTASEDNLIALRIELGAKVQENAALEGTIKEKENAHKKLNQDMHHELDQEKANTFALQEQLANCQRDLTELRAAREELLEARTQLENKEKDLECWKQKLQDSHKQTTASEDNLIALRIELGAKVQENAALEGTIKEKETAQKKLNQDMHLELDQEKANAFALQEQLANCQRDLTELRAAREELLEARMQLENKEKELECWKQKLQDSHKQTTASEDNLIALRIELGAKVQENATLEGTIKEKENKLSEMTQLLDELRTSKSSLTLNDSSMATEPEGLSGIVEADLHSKLDAMEQQLTQTREALSRKEQEHLSAVDKLQEYACQVEQLQGHVEESGSAKVQALQEQLRDMEEQHTIRRDDLKKKYQSKLMEFHKAAESQYRKKIEEVERKYEEDLSKKDRDYQSLFQEKEKYLLLKEELEMRMKHLVSEDKYEKLAEKYEAAKKLLAQANKELKKLKEEQRAKKDMPPPPPAPVIEVKTTVSNADLSQAGSKTEVFKAPVHTPGRSRPGRTKSEINIATRKPPEWTRNLKMDDEQGEFFSSSYLSDMKSGHCDPFNSSRLSELSRRNSMVPPHLQSSYAPEMQNFNGSYSDRDLRQGRLSDVHGLTERTAQMNMGSPAFNTRHRQSTMKNQKSQPEVSLPKPMMNLRKRRSGNLPQPFVPRDDSTPPSVKRLRKEVGAHLQSSYSKPGPPTPAARSSRRNNVSIGSLNTSTASSALNSSTATHDKTHDKTPLLDCTNTTEASVTMNTTGASNVTNRSLRSRIIGTPKSLKKVMTHAFKGGRQKYAVKGRSDKV